MLPQSVVQMFSVIFGASRSAYRLEDGAGVPTAEQPDGFQQKHHSSVPARESEDGDGHRHEYIHGPGRVPKRLLSAADDDVKEIFAAAVHLQAHLRDRTGQEGTRNEKGEEEEKARQGRLLVRLHGLGE